MTTGRPVNQSEVVDLDLMPSTTFLVCLSSMNSRGIIAAQARARGSLGRGSSLQTEVADRATTLKYDAQ